MDALTFHPIYLIPGLLALLAIVIGTLGIRQKMRDDAAKASSEAEAIPQIDLLKSEMGELKNENRLLRQELEWLKRKLEQEPQRTLAPV